MTLRADFDALDLEELRLPDEALVCDEIKLLPPGVRGTDVVYGIQPLAGGPVKIGKTTWGGIPQRLSGLQTGHPYPLRVTSAFRRAPGWEINQFERGFQSLFHEHRLSGEWFTAAPEVAALFRATFDDSVSSYLVEKAAAKAREEGVEAGFYEGMEEQERDWGRALAQVLASKPYAREAMLDVFARGAAHELEIALQKRDAA